MRYALTAGVLFLVVVLLGALALEPRTAAAAIKFDQPAAGPPPGSAHFDTNDCDICDTYPIQSGLPQTIYFTSCLYITHYLYFPTTDTGAPYACSLTPNEYNWVKDRVDEYLRWMTWIGNQTYSSSGNYCRVTDSCGSNTFYKLVPYTTGCGSYTRIYVSQVNYDAIVAASNGMTCAMCYLRSACNFQ